MKLKEINETTFIDKEQIQRIQIEEHDNEYAVIIYFSCGSSIKAKGKLTFEQAKNYVRNQFI